MDWTRTRTEGDAMTEPPIAKYRYTLTITGDANTLA